MWTVMPGAIYRENEVELQYRVHWYTDKITSNDEYIFDFYFSDKPNIDVISYDVIFEQTTMAYLSISFDGQSADANIKMSNSPVSKSISQETNSIAVNKKIDGQIIAATPGEYQGKSKDITPVQTNPPTMAKSMTDTRAADIVDKKKALNAMAKAMSADFAQKTIKIRGNPKLLERCIASNTLIPFGVAGGIWVKVNIFGQDDETGARVPYYYQGWYHLISVQTTLHGGRFEQDLTLVMMIPNVTGEN